MSNSVSNSEMKTFFGMLLLFEIFETGQKNKDENLWATDETSSLSTKNYCDSFEIS